MFFDFILGTIIRGRNFPKITVEVVYQLRTKIRETPLSDLKGARRKTSYLSWRAVRRVTSSRNRSPSRRYDHRDSPVARTLWAVPQVSILLLPFEANLLHFGRRTPDRTFPDFYYNDPPPPIHHIITLRVSSWFFARKLVRFYYNSAKGVHVRSVYLINVFIIKIGIYLLLFRRFPVLLTMLKTALPSTAFPTEDF